MRQELPPLSRHCPGVGAPETRPESFSAVWPESDRLMLFLDLLTHPPAFLVLLMFCSSNFTFFSLFTS